MDIVLSATSGQPLYQQIYEQLSAQIVRGALQSGDCLPPIRLVAAELRISVITVKKAWEELEHAGFIYTMAGKGCFVAPLPGARLSDKRDNLVWERLCGELAYYRSLGLTKADLLALIETWYDAPAAAPDDPACGERAVQREAEDGPARQSSKKAPCGRCFLQPEKEA